MPRQRSPNRDKAKELYINSKGKMPLKDIASQLDIPDTQIRKWKSLDKWDEELKGNVTKTKRNVTNQNKGIEKQPVKELLPEEIETLANEELTEEQRLFCLYYSKSFNATSAYKKAYDRDYQTAMVNGSRLLRNAKIKDEITKLKQERYARSMLNKEDIFQKYLDIACADATDYFDFGREDVETDDGRIFTVNTVKLHESSEVDGTLINEVKQGRDGVSIKLPDRMKALQWLSDHMGWATEEQSKRIALLEAQKAKLEAETKEEEQIEDDGFMKAIQSKEADEWTDEEI